MIVRHTVVIAFTLALFTTSAMADGEVTRGQVTKIDEAQAKLTIQHGPIKKFNIDAMEMIFKAADLAMVKAVKVGDKIDFHVDKVNGQMMVTKLEKAK